MIKALIIEDEKTALDNLLYHIELTKEPVSIAGTLETVEDSINWLNENPSPDLIFMDIHLKDGISFNIFDRAKVSAPIIFVTAYDNFMVKAFEQTSIEYLLKPINEQELQKAITKYKNLKNHFLNNHENLLTFLSEKETIKKSRIVVKKGIEFQSIPLEEVACFFTEQKISFLITRDGKKYLVDKNLKELEEELDGKTFYRANRKFIVNINYIKSYKSYDKIKILIELIIPISEEIIVSQESAIDFRKWIAAL
ncbi:MAG: LytTR family DNA-binding domain-containing protein [Bacteroidota bacterium]